MGHTSVVSFTDLPYLVCFVRFKYQPEAAKASCFASSMRPAFKAPHKA